MAPLKDSLWQQTAFYAAGQVALTDMTLSPTLFSGDTIHQIDV